MWIPGVDDIGFGNHLAFELCFTGELFVIHACAARQHTVMVYFDVCSRIQSESTTSPGLNMVLRYDRVMDQMWRHNVITL